MTYAGTYLDQRPALKRACRLARALLFPGWVMNRRVRTTRMGWGYLGIIIAVAFASFNTGNNMLYLVLSMMLAALVMSFVLSEYMIQDIRIERTAPEFVTQNTPFRVTYKVKNMKRLVPSIGLEIKDDAGALRAFVPVVKAGDVFEARGSGVIKRRGRARFRLAEVSTLAPFAWFEKAKRAPLPGEVVVLPRTAPQEVDRDKISSLGRERPLARPGRGDELFGFRPYTRGDPVKKIHWKTSARAGEPMIRVDEAEIEKRIRIILEADGERRETEDPLLEDRVVKAASMAAAAMEEGWQVRMEAGGRGVEFGIGPGHLHEVLVFLALFDDPERPAGSPLPPTDVTPVTL